MTQKILIWAAGIAVVAVVGWLLYDRMQEKNEKAETEKALLDGVVSGAAGGIGAINGAGIDM